MKDPRLQLSEYPKRNNFFAGRLLTAEDFQAEQEYFRDKHQLHNRLLVGFGVVTGLEVSIDRSAKSETVIKVTPGLAIDCRGREIILLEALEIRVPSSEDVKYVCIHYAENETDPIPLPGADCPRNSKIEESYEIIFQAVNPTRGHRRRKSRWLTCGQDHAIPLARLKQAPGTLRIDGRYHQPSIS